MIAHRARSWLAYYVGLSSTLADATRVAEGGLGGSSVLLVMLAVLRRETLDATVASALVVGAVSIGLIVLLSLLALPHVRRRQSAPIAVPFIDGEPFDAFDPRADLRCRAAGLFRAYLGRQLRRGRPASAIRARASFIRGSVVALAAAIGLYCLWVLAVNGAVAPAALAGETGTALEPLAGRGRPRASYIFGSVFAVLAMGMASIHMSLGLFNQTREWLPVTRARRAPGAAVGTLRPRRPVLARPRCRSRRSSSASRCS